MAKFPGSPLRPTRSTWAPKLTRALDFAPSIALVCSELVRMRRSRTLCRCHVARAGRAQSQVLVGAGRGLRGAAALTERVFVPHPRCARSWPSGPWRRRFLHPSRLVGVAAGG